MTSYVHLTRERFAAFRASDRPSPIHMIGPRDQRRDLCFIAQYPGVAAFVEMIRDPAYREPVTHRRAAAEDSRLTRVAPSEVGVGFG